MQAGCVEYKLNRHCAGRLRRRKGGFGLDLFAIGIQKRFAGRLVHEYTGYGVEKSGQLHGLMRVRCFTQDDAHIFMTPEQVRDEIKGVVKLINEVYSLFGFKYHVELSTRPEDSMGSDEDWDMATEALRGALDDLGLPYVVNEGDGAFYGPKIDFHLEDSCEFIGSFLWCHAFCPEHL